MTPPDRKEILSLLEAGGFEAGVEPIEIYGGRPDAPPAVSEVILGEQPLLLVAILVARAWSDVEETAEDLVIGIADLVADRDPGARQLDLTIFLLLEEELDEQDLPAATQWASSTNYARRVVADGLTRSSLERALLPVLPIRLDQPGKLEPRLFDQLRTRLAAELGDEAAGLAVASFESSGEVQIS
jgi:hypothetical protein